MNEILYNSYNQKLNLNIDNNQGVYKTNSNTVTSKTSNEKSTSSDSIEITEQNENIINTKKAHDAFKDACSEKDMSCMYIIVKEMMKDDGINVPDFTSSNATNFIPFIDKLKSYANNLIDGNDTSFHQIGTSPLSYDFLDFCDSYKEKLIQNGCN